MAIECKSLTINTQRVNRYICPTMRNTCQWTRVLDQSVDPSTDTDLHNIHRSHTNKHLTTTQHRYLLKYSRHHYTLTDLNNKIIH